MCFSVRSSRSSRRRRAHRTRDSVDGGSGVPACTELFYNGEFGGSASGSNTADYRAVGLSDLRGRGGGSSNSGADTGCASCLSCEPAGSGKPRAVVCTVQNTRTATLVHRLDVAPTGSCGQRCQYGYATDDTTGGGRPRTPGRGSAYASKQEIYCHSPYCIYATSGTSRRLQTFKGQGSTTPAPAPAPDVAVYGPGRRKEGEENDSADTVGQDEEGRVDQLADRIDTMHGAAEGARGSQGGDAVQRWLRGTRGSEDEDRTEAVEAGSRRSSEESCPPSPTNSVMLSPRPDADVLQDILGLAASTSTSVDVPPRHVANGLYNDHIANNNYNNNNVVS